MGCGFFRTAGVAVIWSALAFTAFAQTPPPASRFDITGYSVEGSPLLSSEDLSRIVASLIGRQKSAADVQKAQQSLQQAYLDLGHCSVQVTVPRMSPDGGVITFWLVQMPAPLSKDCLPMVALDGPHAAPPVTAAPRDVAALSIAGGSERAPTAPQLALKPATALAPASSPSPRTDNAPAAKIDGAPAIASTPAVAPSAPQLKLKSENALAFAPQSAVVAAPASVPKVEAQPATKPGPGSTPVAGKSTIAAASTPATESKPDAATAGKTAPTRSEPASTARIAESTPIKEAPAQKKPAPKPAPIVVHAPRGSLQSTTVGVPPQTAQPADPNAPVAPLKFLIERFLVEGNTVLKPETISSVLVRYTGAQKDFGDVQRALEALQVAYQDAGYGAVQVTLPEQELDDGEVELNVIETRLGKIDVQGNDYHNEQNIRSSLPDIKEGITPNSAAIARNLRIANENSSKQTQVALRAGTQDGEVDATIKVIDDSPIKRSVSLDNTGSYASGKYRTGFGYQHANMFNRDHVLTLQYMTSPEHPSAVTVLGFGYRVPLYKLGHSIDVIAGYSDVTSATVAQLFNVSGAGTVFGLRYNQNLGRSENFEQKITYGIDYRAFKNSVTFITSTQPIVPDITVHPVSITYTGFRRTADSQFDFYGSYSQNIFPGGNDGANSDFQGPTAEFPTGSRAGAKAGYNVFRAGANYTRQIWGEWQARGVFATQYTDNALIAGEQFGAGGSDSVRGFDERAFSNDRGYRATFELYTPDMAPNFRWSGGRIKFLVFYDTANLTRNMRQPSEQDGVSLDSFGLGLRLQTKNYLSLRADYAQVLHDGGIGGGRRNANTLHASMIVVF